MTQPPSVQPYASVIDAFGNTSNASSSNDNGPGAPEDNITRNAPSGGRPFARHQSAIIASIDGTRNTKSLCSAYSSAATAGSNAAMIRVRAPTTSAPSVNPP